MLKIRVQIECATQWISKEKEIAMINATELWYIKITDPGSLW